MLRRKTASAIVVMGLMVLAKTAAAQQNGSDQQFRPFNGFFADLFDDSKNPKPQAQPQTQRQVQHYYNYNPDATPSKPAPTPAMPLQPLAGPPSDATALSAAPKTSASQNSATGKNYAFQYQDNSSASSSGTTQAPAGSDSATNNLLLHERLKALRQSPFGEAALAELGPPPAAAPVEPATPRPSETPVVAQPTPAVLQPSPAVAQPTPLAAPPTEVTATPRATPEPQRLETAKTANDGAQEPSVLMNHKSPLLSVETIGPRKIVVGKEAAYEVLLQNSGDVAAEEVSVTVALPDWAEVASAAPSNGEVHPALQDRHEPCRWELGRIEAHSKEKLALKIVPKASKPFELAVRWDFKKSLSQAMIEVQEPKLTMRLDGPREVVFGKREIFKLKLGNRGNGPAENVVLTLMPLSASDTRPITHRLGTINPADERSIEVELTARQAGRLTIRVEANGDGGSHVELAEHVLVHRGTLQVDVEGPAVQYVGTPANFRIRLRNSGDAPANNVKLTAKLPSGVKFVSGSEGAVLETIAGGSKVRWTLEQLQPGEQRAVEMKCTLGVAGANRIEITSAADDDLAASTEAVTQVEAMADLRLEVKDPEGPVPVGSEATYELRVRNRGTKAAEYVEVRTYFSSGVEPVNAEGQRNHMGAGQVVFDLIPAIAPGSELVLKVHAKAGTAGNHVFRAEVHCKRTGTRLVREEVTHYYQDGPTLQQTANSPAATPAPRAGPAFRDEPLTAEREAPLPLPQSQGSPLPTPAIRR